MLSRTSGRLFFLAALPSSDLAAFQSGRQRQSPASDCLRAWELYESTLRELALIVFILLHFDSVHLQGPSSIIALTAGSSLLQALFFGVQVNSLSRLFQRLLLLMLIQCKLLEYSR